MALQKINTIYATREELQRNARIESALGTVEICRRCGATLATYHDKCRAGFNEGCPGFDAISRAAVDSGRGR